MEEEVTVSAYTRKKIKQQGAVKELPVVLEIIDFPENEKIGPDGKPKIYVNSVDTDKVEYSPEKLFIFRIRRLQYRNASDNTSSDDEKTIFSIPALPPQIAPKSCFSPSLLAYLIVSKYLDALPLNRIEKRLARSGYLLSRATMVNGLLNVAKKCEILTDLMLKELKNGFAILMDETPFQVHQEHERKNKTKSFIWVIRGGPRTSLLYYSNITPHVKKRYLCFILAITKDFSRPMATMDISR
jgi:transposase